MVAITTDLNLSSLTIASRGTLLRQVAATLLWNDLGSQITVSGASLTGTGVALGCIGLIPNGANGVIQLIDSIIYNRLDGDNRTPNTSIAGSTVDLTGSQWYHTRVANDAPQTLQARNGANVRFVLRNSTFIYPEEFRASAGRPGLNIAGATGEGNDLTGLALDGFWFNDIIATSIIGADFRDAQARTVGAPYIIRCGRPSGPNQNNTNTELTKWYAGVRWPTLAGNDGLNCFNTNVDGAGPNVLNEANRPQIWILDPEFRADGLLPVNYFFTALTARDSPFVNLAYSYRPRIVTPLGVDRTPEAIIKFDDAVYDIFGAIPAVDGVLDADGVPVRSLNNVDVPVATVTNSVVAQRGYYVRHQRDIAGAAGGGTIGTTATDPTVFMRNTAIDTATDSHLILSLPLIVPGTATDRHTFGFTNEGVNVLAGGAITDARDIVMIADPFFQGETTVPASRTDPLEDSVNNFYRFWKSDIIGSTGLIDPGAEFVQNGSAFETTRPINFRSTEIRAIINADNTAVERYESSQPIVRVSPDEGAITAIDTTMTMDLPDGGMTGFTLRAGVSISAPGGAVSGCQITTGVFNQSSLYSIIGSTILANSYVGTGDFNMSPLGAVTSLISTPTLTNTGNIAIENGLITADNLTAANLSLDDGRITPFGQTGGGIITISGTTTGVAGSELNAVNSGAITFGAIEGVNVRSLTTGNLAFDTVNGSGHQLTANGSMVANGNILGMDHVFTWTTGFNSGGRDARIETTNPRFNSRGGPEISSNFTVPTLLTAGVVNTTGDISTQTLNSDWRTNGTTVSCRDLFSQGTTLVDGAGLITGGTYNIRDYLAWETDATGAEVRRYPARFDTVDFATMRSFRSSDFFDRNSTFTMTGTFNVTGGVAMSDTAMTALSINFEDTSLNPVPLVRPVLEATSFVQLNNYIVDGGTVTSPDTRVGTFIQIAGAPNAVNFPDSIARAAQLNGTFNGVLNIETDATEGTKLLVLGDDFNTTTGVTINNTGGGRLFVGTLIKPVVGTTVEVPLGTVLGVNTDGSRVRLEPVPVDDFQQFQSEIAPTIARMTGVGSQWKLYVRSASDINADRPGTLLVANFSADANDYVSPAGALQVRGDINPNFTALQIQQQGWVGPRISGLGFGSNSQLYLVTGNGRGTKVRHIALTVRQETAQFVYLSGSRSPSDLTNVPEGYLDGAVPTISTAEITITPDLNIPPASVLSPTASITIASGLVGGEAAQADWEVTGYSIAVTGEIRASEQETRALFANIREDRLYLRQCAEHFGVQHETDTNFQRTINNIFLAPVNQDRQTDYEPIEFTETDVLFKGTDIASLAYRLSGGDGHEDFTNMLVVRDDGQNTLLDQSIRRGIGITARQNSATAVATISTADTDGNPTVESIDRPPPPEGGANLVDITGALIPHIYAAS